MNRPGVPAPGFVKRIGPIVDARRETVFQELQSVELVNRLKPGPDGSGMPFGWTVNPFRGCEIGCTYCYARPTHEYLGHADPEEFESRVYVKRADPGPAARRPFAARGPAARKSPSGPPPIPISRPRDAFA